MDMIEIFLKLNILIQVLIINTAMIITIAVFYFSAKFGLRFTSGSDGFSFSFGNKGPRAKKKIKKTGWIVVESMRKIREIERRIIEIRYMETIKKQMGIAEGAVKSIITESLQSYTSLLKNKKHKDPIKTTSCQSYMLLLRVIEHRLVDKLRLYVRENHFAEKTEVEFDSYIESKTKALIYLISESLNNLYHYDEDITRAELYDANKEKIRIVEHILLDCFREFRISAIDSVEKVEKLESKINSIFSEFIHD